MAHNALRVAMLCDSGEAVTRYEVSQFDSLQFLLEQPAFDILLIDLPAEGAREALCHLRQVEAYQLGLLYCCQDLDQWGAALSDGPAPTNYGQLESQWRQWSERLSLFNRGRPPERMESRLLAWLWVRPKAQIRAVCDPGSHHHYRYPLLEALAADDSFNAHGWLQLMQQKDWLVPADLLDRTRLCAACGSARLNYVDVCPECQTLDIIRQPSLHCFTCGHVGAQEAFLKEGALICPNCFSRLRHIGSDYDRPLENYRCHGCRAFFVDAAVVARCLDCQSVHSPDRLRVREVRHYRLSESGRLRCRQGVENSQSAESYFERLNLTGESGFHELVNWQLALVKRYGKPEFSLLGLRIDNLEQLFADQGSMRAHALIDALVERLQESIRDTDRCMRSREDVLWMLLPNTPESGAQRLQQRLLAGSEALQGDAAQSIALRMVGFTAPQDMQEDEGAPLLLARLSAVLG
jgi:GGDEF domain-containing protein